MIVNSQRKFYGNTFTPRVYGKHTQYLSFIASQDTLEVMFVRPSVTLITKLTDVTLVSEDTY